MFTTGLFTKHYVHNRPAHNRPHSKQEAFSTDHNPNRLVRNRPVDYRPLS